MKVTIRPELKMVYPGAVFGCLTVRDAANMRQYEGLEDGKRRLEKRIREEYPEPRDDPVIRSYGEYFARWGKTYPIQFQIRSIKSGKTFPRVTALVDCMFMAELKNRVLTSGHDQDTVEGGLVFDLASEGEVYTKLSGEPQALEKVEGIKEAKADHKKGRALVTLKEGAEVDAKKLVDAVNATEMYTAEKA